MITNIIDKTLNIVDKFIPDKEKKQELKAELEKQLFEDLKNAREYATNETENTHKIINDLRALVRPVISFSSIFFYMYMKTENIPLSNFDYAILISIFTFYFGLRTFEKIKLT